MIHQTEYGPLCLCTSGASLLVFMHTLYMSEVASTQSRISCNSPQFPQEFPLTTCINKSVMISSSILDCTEIPSFLFTLNESWIDKLFLCSGWCWKIQWNYFLVQDRQWLSWKIATWCWAVFNHKCECGFRSQKYHPNTQCFSFLVNSSSMSTITVTDCTVWPSLSQRE